MVVDVYDGKNDLKRQIADWKARAKELERERDQAIRDLSEQARLRGEAEGKLMASALPGVIEGWKARAEAAEARVKELEAALTVTDEMVERAAKAIAKTFLVSSDSDEVWMMGSGTHCVEFSGLIDPLPLARAALTAALEGKDE